MKHKEMLICGSSLVLPQAEFRSECHMETKLFEQDSGLHFSGSRLVGEMDKREVSTFVQRW